MKPEYDPENPSKLDLLLQKEQSRAKASPDAICYGGISEDCPECGDEMEAKKPFYDGDLATCPDCGFESGISVDEDGSYWLQEH